MKIFLTYPPLKGKGIPMLSQNRQFQWFSEGSHIYPVILGYAATILQNEGHLVRWKDYSLDSRGFLIFYGELLDELPDLIAIETKTPVIKQHWELINRIKTILPEIKIVLMGDHPTNFPLESLEKSKADYILIGGHFDYGLLSIINFITGKGQKFCNFYFRDKERLRFFKGTGMRSKLLNELPCIDRDLTRADYYGEKWKKKKRFFYTMAGRDCHWGKCIFCSWTSLFKEYLCMSPARLLKEIDFLNSNYSAEELFDDSGTFPDGEWLKTFCEDYIKRGYSKKLLFSCNFRNDMLTEENCKLLIRTGFRKLKIGLESANPVTLERLKKNFSLLEFEKGLSRLKGRVDIHLTVMVGYPWESGREIENTLKFVKRLMDKGLIEMLQSTVVMPYPGTPLFKMAIENKWLKIPPDDYEKYDMKSPVLKVEGLDDKEILEYCRNFYRLFYSPRYALHRLGNLKELEDFNYFFRGVRAVSGHLKDFFK